MQTIPGDLRDSLVGSYIDAHNTSYPEAQTAVDDALTHGYNSPHAAEFTKALRPLWKESVAYVRTVCDRIPQEVHDAVSDGTATLADELRDDYDPATDDAWERGQDTMRWTPN